MYAKTRHKSVLPRQDHKYLLLFNKNLDAVHIDPIKR